MNSTPALNVLLESIEAKVFIVIENEFQVETSPEEAIGKLFSLGQEAKTLLVELNEGLNDFFGAFNDLEKELEQIDLDIKTTYISRGRFDRIEEKTKKKIKSLENCIQEYAKHPEEVKKALFRFGICKAPSSNAYSFWKALPDNVIKLVWKEVPDYSIEELDDFKRFTSKAIEKTNSRFGVLVIDKIMDGAKSGDEFAEKVFDECGQFISFIYTTSPDENAEAPTSKKDYFIREIKKETEETEQNFSNCIAQNAWVILFDKFSETIKYGAEQAFQLSVSNLENISKILNTADEEGNSPYESVEAWFSLATQFYGQNKFLNDIKYITSLAQYYPDGVPDSDIANELLDVNSFEVFDYNVNAKQLPVNSGDIYKFELNGDEKFFVLFGQTCDLSIRRNSERSAKYAELIPFTIENPKPKYGKFQITGSRDSETSYINISGFKYTGEYKRIKVRLSSKDIEFIDNRILDLSMFNSNGKCELNFNDDLSKSFLPSGIKDYYSDLKKNLEEIAVHKQESKTIFVDTSAIVDINNFEITDDNFKFKIERVARINEKFMVRFFQEVSNYKGRIGLGYYDYKQQK